MNLECSKIYSGRGNIKRVTIVLGQPRSKTINMYILYLLMIEEIKINK